MSTSRLRWLARAASRPLVALHGVWLLAGRRPDRRPQELLDDMARPPGTPRPTAPVGGRRDRGSVA